MFAVGGGCVCGNGPFWLMTPGCLGCALRLCLQSLLTKDLRISQPSLSQRLDADSVKSSDSGLEGY